MFFAEGLRIKRLLPPVLLAAGLLGLVSVLTKYQNRLVAGLVLVAVERPERERQPGRTPANPACHES